MEMEMSLKEIGVAMQNDPLKKTDDTKIGGKVKRTFPNDGFIFITGDDGTDYFGHVSQIQAGIQIIELRAGQRCSFVPTQKVRGPAAEFIEFSE
jgi:cold shock CspA family protein